MKKKEVQLAACRTHLRVTNSGSLRIFSHAPIPCFLTARLSAFSSFSLQYPRTDVVVVVVVPPGVPVVGVVFVVDVVVGLPRGGSAAGRFLVDAADGFLPPAVPAGFFLGGICLSRKGCRALRIVVPLASARAVVSRRTDERRKPAGVRARAKRTQFAHRRTFFIIPWFVRTCGF